MDSRQILERTLGYLNQTTKAGAFRYEIREKENDKTLTIYQGNDGLLSKTFPKNKVSSMDITDMVISELCRAGLAHIQEYKVSMETQKELVKDTSATINQ